MARTISIGNQSFEEIREKGYFLVDKTNLIKEWWESADSVTLITRPRRFGKTINMDMLNCFFSNRFQGRRDLFEGLSIWKEEVYRRLQGSYPVIFLSFADVKQNNCKDAIQKIKTIITGVYRQFFDTQDKLPSRIVQMMQENMSDAKCFADLVRGIGKTMWEKSVNLSGRVRYADAGSLSSRILG